MGHTAEDDALIHGFEEVARAIRNGECDKPPNVPASQAEVVSSIVIDVGATLSDRDMLLS